MNVYPRQVFILLFCVLSIFFIGCQKPWDVTVFEEKAGHPILCVGRNGKCTGRKEQNLYIKIEEIDKVDGTRKTVWFTYFTSYQTLDSMLNRVEYGKALQGWVDKVPASPIKNDTYYLINSQYYFLRTAEGKYVVLHGNECINEAERKRLESY